MHKPESTEHGATFDLAAVEREMRKESGYEHSGHLGRTLVRTSDLTVMLMVMRRGSHVAEHQANATASIQVLSGKVRLKLEARTVELTSGQLLALESGLRHNLEAPEDSAFVLTLGVHGKR